MSSITARTDDLRRQGGLLLVYIDKCSNKSGFVWGKPLLGLLSLCLPVCIPEQFEMDTEVVTKTMCGVNVPLIS